ncbi:ATP-grasp domain-containing protein [Bradyrhizobium sp. S3.2.12]|uniref:ATP-grasp domain-containing protein n=1 Tax=Bradyrhizobium sp. S3.2.12 TaxID=3156387 RepID=UPI0033969737
MPKKALILLEGASNGQLYVQAANRLGLRPVTLSTDPGQYQYLASGGWDAIRVDTGNLDATVTECLRQSSICGIAGITSARESAYAAVGKLCQHFNLPGPQPAAIELCCDKFLQRQLLEENSIPIPGYRLAANAAEVERSAEELGFPVIVKPAVGIASVGVRLCRDPGELAQHADYLLGERKIRLSSPRILVEEFAQGPHYSIEIMGSEVIAIGAADFGRPPHFVCREYIYPAVVKEEDYERIVDVSQKCLRALNLSWGPKNIDLRLTERGPVVIEVNPRLAGTPNSQLIKFAYGIDPISEHIKLAIGTQCNLHRSSSNTAAARILIADRDGTFEFTGGDSRAKAIPGVTEVKLYIERTTQILRKGDNRDRIGHIIAVSRNPAEVLVALQSAADLLDWSITPSRPPGR